MTNTTNTTALKYVKRLNYEKVEIATLGGSLLIERQKTGGLSVTFMSTTGAPARAFTESVEEAAASLSREIHRIADAIAEDLTAFAERNK